MYCTPLVSSLLKNSQYNLHPACIVVAVTGLAAQLDICNCEQFEYYH